MEHDNGYGSCGRWEARSRRGEGIGLLLSWRRLPAGCSSGSGDGGDSMAEPIVISDSEDTGNAPLGAQQQGTGWRLEQSLPGGAGAQDLIDLTDFDDHVIDLTANEHMNFEFDQLISSESLSNSSCLLSGGQSDSESSNNACWLSGDSRLLNDEIPDCEGRFAESSWRSTYSHQRISDCASDVKNQEVSRCDSIDEDLAFQTNVKGPLKNCSTLQSWQPEATCTVYLQDNHSQPVPSSTSTQTVVKQEDSKEEPDAQAVHLNNALLYKLRYFKKPPVNHFFFNTFKNDKKLPSVPIPLSRMSIVNNTKDESFHQGTLHFLNEFVSAHYYPPKDIISHVINSILLCAEEQAIEHEAYMILMKVQKMHPATLDTVAWDWKLLSEVMEKKTCCLFLQYVVQTLDDDFQRSLQRRSLKRCLCKTMLSCDRFSNVKNVIHWLMDNISGIGLDKELDTCSECDRERMVFLLQRMLSIAVEVDNLPTMNSNRIADFIFPYFIVLKTRQQRELFLCSTENHLLRAKILEVIFQNSCDASLPQDQSLSLDQILFFIGNSTLRLENQVQLCGEVQDPLLVVHIIYDWKTPALVLPITLTGAEWQRWDEMLLYIYLLFVSLQKIMTDHLRTQVTDRIDESLKKPHSQLPASEEITEEDVEASLNTFKKRVFLGAETPSALKDRIQMLRSLLLTAVKRHT
ncbi:SUMO-interacting motif-containing protein 1 isoform X2 [Pseudophryne corroboree]|uniref:SUMO-interacting motif-containing protein 1 isoform X2 n=1 Tax=Pseudophryne corroboree TaxID=495146 RepID=UPI003082024D